MTDFETISKLFSGFIENSHSSFRSEKKIDHLIWSNIRTNQILWDLEDSARLSGLGDKHIADTKRKIDKNNQFRNDLIREIDIEITNQMEISSGLQEKFYSESPGMIIDRLAIIFIKLSIIQNLLTIITEDDLKKEYKEKESIILKQMDRIGNFLDSYFSKLANKDIFFEIQQPVKIYNDDRVRGYIKILKRKSE